MNRKGVALYIVLMVLLIVVVVASVILSLISSHSTLTTHQVKRIQSLYAAQAAINYAAEALRANDINWITTSDPITHYMCREVTTTKPCNSTTLSSSGSNITEPDLPASVAYVEITINAPVNDQRKIIANVYTSD